MKINYGKIELKNWGIFIVILCNFFLFLSCNHQQHQRPQMTPEVSIVTVKTESVSLDMELPGRASAYLVAEIRPQVNGLVLKRVFKEGAYVKKGDLLYQIDPAPYKAAFNQAKAAVAMVEANLPALRSRVERFKGLLKIKAVGQQDYDDALAALNQAVSQLAVNKAALKNAKINLAYTSIKAPISGQIGRSCVTKGAIVTAYQPVPLAKIQQIDPIYVDVPQSTVELLQLKKRLADGRLDHNGTQHIVTIIEEDGNLYPLKGKLQFQDISVDPTTGSIILRALVPNPKSRLLPGMFVNVRLNEGVKENAILIPQQCVQRNPKGLPFVFAVDKTNTTNLKMINIDRAIGDKWLVTKGLSKGDNVVFEGMQRVRPGTKVNVVPIGKMKKTRNKAKHGGK